MITFSDSHEEGITEALDRFFSDIKKLGPNYQAVAAVASDESHVYTSGLMDSPESFLQFAASLLRAACTSYGWDEEDVAIANAIVTRAVIDAIREEAPRRGLPLS